MGRTVNVGILVGIEVSNAINHRLRLVRGGRVVKPHQLFAIHTLLQDGKITAHRMHVKARMPGLVSLWHTL